MNANTDTDTDTDADANTDTDKDILGYEYLEQALRSAHLMHPDVLERQHLWLAVPCAVPASPLLYTHTYKYILSHIHRIYIHTTFTGNTARMARNTNCRICVTIAVYTHKHSLSNTST